MGGGINYPPKLSDGTDGRERYWSDREQLTEPQGTKVQLGVVTLPSG